MTKLNEMISAVFLMSVPIFVMSSCQEQEGAAEQIGKNLDKALANVAVQMEKPADKMKNVAQDKQK